MMQNKITRMRTVLLVLCLGIATGSILAHRPERFGTSGAEGRKGFDFSTFDSSSFFAEAPQLLGPAQALARQLDGPPEQVAQGSPRLDRGPAALLAAPHKKPQGRRASPALLLDSLTPRAPNMVHVVARRPDGTVFYDQTFHNLRTNAGINWQYNQMAGTTAAVCTYIALSNDSTAPAATDTAVASEITTNGLARASGTATHTSNATSYTVAYTFTATGTQSAQKAGLLNASSSGALCFENTFTSVSLASGDTLAVTWTINF